MKKILTARVIENKKIAENIYDLTLDAKSIADIAQAGQFVELYPRTGVMILPRPISICEADRKRGTLRLIYQVVGKGTDLFSKKQAGDYIDILGPCGNGFFINDSDTEHVIVAGGIGAPPMVQLAKQLKGHITVFLGAKSTPILAEEFQELGAEVHIATDDGSVGFHGNVVELLSAIDPKIHMIYSCGPKVMLKSLSQWAEIHQVKAQVSMEERMACGIGVCVGCAIKIKKENESDWSHLKVCKDGPVFWSSEVIWDE
ncbi:MAG: dihydroorotate dehydrogenase electron transfer subunit [Clostridiales bacterium]|nr:dihydroorotate dehydrogenase electron transfer subunit [Clostridiales bacterium]